MSNAGKQVDYRSTPLKLRQAGLVFLLPAAISLAAYLKTVAPGVYFSDTAELQRVAFTMELPHPTGYPLYILLGRLWLLALTHGSVAWRMNLLSAIYASLAVGALSLLVYQLAKRVVPALLAGLILASSASFWSQAVIAEVYTLHALLMVLYLTALFHADQHESRAWLPAFVLGLAFSHHRMTMLVLPGTVLYLVSDSRFISRATPKAVGKVIIAFVLGLTPYLLTYLRGDWVSLSAFLGYVSHRGEAWISFSNILGYFGGTVGPLLRQQLGLVGLAMSFLGLGSLFAQSPFRSPRVGLFFLASWLTALAFLLVYRVPDIFAFLPHLLVLHAILIGLGMAWILVWLESRVRPSQRASVNALALVLVITSVFLQGRISWRANDRAEERWPAQRSLAILQNVASHGVLLADWVLGQSLLYQQAVEGLRTDVTILIQRPLSSADQYLRDGRPVYTLQKDTTCPACELVPAEPTQYEQSLMRVLLPGTLESLPGLKRLLDIEAAPGLTLHSYTLSPWPLQPDQPARLRLCWTGQASLLSAKIGKLEIDLPNGWLGQEFRFEGEPDATGCTVHDFVVPPAPFVDEAEARLSVFLADAAQPEVSLSIGTVPIAPWMERATPERLMTRVSSAGMVVGQGAELLGLTNDSVTSPGISFPVTAYWKHPTPGIGPQPEIVLELQDPSQAIVDRRTVAMAPALPVERWPAPGITAARYGLTVPRLAMPGTYAILAGTPADQRRTQVGAIEVQDFSRVYRAPSITNRTKLGFADNSIRLEGYDIARDPEKVRLTLYWKAAGPVGGNWKVFCHIVNKRGDLIAQDDSFPAGGLRWTDTWRPGEYVTDVHTIALPSSVAPGQYGVRIGLYDPETGTRIPLQNPMGSGASVDAAELTTIEIPQ